VKRERARVLIVEDHQVVAEGLAALINDQKDMTVVGSAGSVAESILRATELGPDIVLMDFCLLYTSPSPRDLSTSRMPSSA